MPNFISCFPVTEESQFRRPLLVNRFLDAITYLYNSICRMYSLRIRVFTTIFLLLSSYAVASDTDPNICWNIGTLDVCWNHFSQDQSNQLGMDNTLLSFVDLDVYFGKNNFGIETSLIQNRKRKDSFPIVTMLPMNVFYNFAQWGPLFLGTFLKGEIDSLDNKTDPYLEFGIRFYDFAQSDPNRWNYSWKNSIYLSCDSRGQVNIGTQFDMGSFFLFVLAGQAATLNENKTT